MRSEVAEAARRLAAGELVAFPTETVYGLGADATSADAVAAVYRAKGRPAGHPLIVHVLDEEQARWWADLDSDAKRLIDAFWPGPLTLIVERRAGVPAYACGGEATIGLRSPAHPVARALLEAFAALGGRGVAAPSANRFGRVSPTEAAHVRDDLGDATLTILDGGPCELGLESTIVDLSRARPLVLRPGAIELARIEAALRERGRDSGRSRPSGVPPAGGATGEPRAPRAPGTLAAHYAPRTPLELVPATRLADRVEELAAAGVKVAVMSRSAPGAPVVHWECAAGDARGYAHNLYRALRALDAARADRILVEAVDTTASWAAIADRLARAEATFRER
ncbi:MAG: threonylcarbamoyl-AMP synthase [Burkholderiaceae bacterium]|nr:threonylcarbamoyl-AMP synthase [Burkholderiaceae bacterium]